jgi:hypothetical protein
MPTVKRYPFKPLLLVILLYLSSTSSCNLYNDFSLKGDYTLSTGLYYDGVMYPIEEITGTLTMGTSTYEMDYSVSFEKKSGEIINEVRNESGIYGYTSEAERTVYGTNEKFFSGLIFFYPDTINGPDTLESWSMKYEFLLKSKVLLLDGSGNFTEQGYYTELEWDQQ